MLPALLRVAARGAQKNSAAAMAAAVTAPASALDSEDGNFCERLTDEQARLKEFNLSLLVRLISIREFSRQSPVPDPLSCLLLITR